MPRKIYIQMDARDAKDNPEILDNVCNTFKIDDIHFDLRQIDHSDVPIKQDKELEAKAIEEASEVLEQQQKIVSSEKEKKPTIEPNNKKIEKSKKEVKGWLSRIDQKNIKFVMKVLEWAKDFFGDSDPTNMVA